MRASFRHKIIATTAIIGLSGFAALAAPPVAGDPPVVRPSVTQPRPAAAYGMTGKIEERITDLHVKLGILPAQQPQWDQFTQVMRDNARDTDQTFRRRVESMPAMTAMQNMQSYADVAMTHAQDVQKLVPAFQALYESMSETQKRTTDQVFRDDAHRGARTPMGAGAKHG